MTSEVKPSGAVRGVPQAILRAEAAVVMAAAVTAYAATGASWWVFAALFLAPDLSMLGYLAGPKTGSIAYNIGQSYVLPALLVALGLVLTDRWMAPLGLIWAAHIGFDRMVGYGLKYADAFGATHLGWKGKARPA